MTSLDTATLADKLSRLVPYSDGGARRRLLAGVIVGVTAWSLLGNDPRTLLTTPILKELLTESALVAIALGVGIYLVGTLVELIGNTSLVRAAAEGVREARVSISAGQPPPLIRRLARSFVVGLTSVILLIVIVESSEPGRSDYWLTPFTATAAVEIAIAYGFIVLVGLPMDWLLGVVHHQVQRISHYQSLRLAFNRRVTLPIRFTLWWPTRVAIATIGGALGKTETSFRLEKRLSSEAASRHARFPPRVQTGLNNPTGDYGDFALHFLLQQFAEPVNAKWARRLVSRMRDVSTTISAIVVSLILVLLVGFFGERAADSRALPVPTLSDFSSRPTVSDSDFPRSAPGRRSFRRMSPNNETDSQHELVISVRRAASRLRRAEAEVESQRRLYSSGSEPLFNSVGGSLDAYVSDSREAHATLSTQWTSRPQVAMDALASWKTAVDSLEASLKVVHAENAKRAIERARQTGVRAALLVACQFALFLYLILFTNLRSAVESMIEALAFETHPQPSAEPPKLHPPFPAIGETESTPASAQGAHGS